MTSVTRPTSVGLTADVAVMMVVSTVPVIASDGTLTVTVMSSVWSINNIAVPGTVTGVPFNDADRVDQLCE